MNNYAYADNDYNPESSFRGANNAMIALQAIKARQHQEAIENAMAMDRLRMAQELHIPQMEAQRMQTEQARAAIGEHNARLAEFQRLTQGAKTVQDIGASIVGGQNFPSQEMATNMVNAQRQVPGLIPQGRFDVPVPNQAALGPTPEAPPISQFPGLPQAPDYSPLINQLVTSGQGGIGAIMRGAAASTPGTSAELLKPYQQGDQAMLDQFGRQVAPAGPMSAYQTGHLAEMAAAQADKRDTDIREQYLRGLHPLLTARPSSPFATPDQAEAETNKRIEMYNKQFQQYGAPQGGRPAQTTQGVTPPYRYNIGDLEKEAMDMIIRNKGVNTEAIKQRYKEATGKDLVLPADFDIPKAIRGG